ncbi:MAG: CBS domain-containing protein [Deltaproteobacteria bacterium]|nr:CBS domain-containing protein [Deltaproteobacteria bacterium]MBW2418406.1 CBS domain-containing protein [Deltaproteobacteria bacterium]
MTKFAEDLMQTQVVTVGTDDPLASVFRLFTDEEISGAPVVNEYGRVVGVVSIRDLLRSRNEEQDSTQTDLDFFRDGLAYAKSEGMMGDLDYEERLAQRMVSDVMTEDVIAVRRQTPISDVVKTILENRIHRILVVDEGQNGTSLAGLISLFDLVALLDPDHT